MPTGLAISHIMLDIGHNNPHTLRISKLGYRNGLSFSWEGENYAEEVPIIMPLAAALAALTGTAVVVAAPAEAKTIEPGPSNPASATSVSGLMPNRIVSIGEDLLGFIVTDMADGTVVAQHYSHSSHSSHASHYSSR